MQEKSYYHPKLGQLYQIGERYRVREYNDKFVVIDRVLLSQIMELFDEIRADSWELSLFQYPFSSDPVYWKDFDKALDLVRALEHAEKQGEIF